MITLSDPSTFIKLDRNILKWEWYTDGNTMRVFIHLLLNANIKPAKFRFVRVNRGDIVTSVESISTRLKMSQSQVRTALKHLQQTGEIKVKSFNVFSLITINNYDRYQADKSTTKRTNTRHKTSDVKSEKKEEKQEEENKYIPQHWEISIPEHFHGMFATEDQWLEFVADNRSEVEKWVMN